MPERSLVKCSKCGKPRRVGARCKACKREYAKLYRKRPGQKAKEDRRNRHYYTLIKQNKRAGNLERLYGIGYSEYEQLVIRQSGRCGCCGKPEQRSKHLFVDHDHETGRLRGLLCHKCNTGIGLLGDNTEGLIAAVEYLNE